VDARPKPIEDDVLYFEKLALERKRNQEIESTESTELEAN
jgi:hypothetical protein